MRVLRTWDSLLDTYYLPNKSFCSPLAPLTMVNQRTVFETAQLCILCRNNLHYPYTGNRTRSKSEGAL
jgi:hypothetical protein